MTTGNKERDAALAVVYRDLIATESHLCQAQNALMALGWTTAGKDLADAAAVVSDLLHDLSAYAGSTGGESRQHERRVVSAQQRYAALPHRSRRLAARQVRKAFGTDSRTRMRIDVWAELALENLILDGEIDAYWLYCWELGTRMNNLRQVANLAAGAR